MHEESIDSDGTDAEPPDLDSGDAPAVFVLQTVYKGTRHTVADGVFFPPPAEQVVVNWYNTDSVELIGSVEALYERFGPAPNVLWRRSGEVLSEAEPAGVV